MIKLKKKPKISIIIPVYNSEKYLSFCLESILKQTYKNFEIIAIDDGSVDKSLDILKDYEKKYKNIRVYHQENKGVGKTRNKGLTYVTGEYFTFCDNDDYLEEDYLESFISANDKNYDILVSGYIRKSYSGKVLFTRKLDDKPLSLYIQQACWGKLYKTDFIKQNNICFLDSKIADEFYFNVISYNKTNKIKILPTTKYHWMFNDDSLSNTDNKKLNYVDELLDNLEIIDNKLSDIKEKDYELIQYFYLRTIIYYLLFSCKKVPKNKIYSSYSKMFSWLDKKGINYSKNKYLSIIENNGEQTSVKWIIHIFLLLRKLHLIRVFLYIFSKI